MGVDKKYRLYVFDLDGTLVDTRLDIGRALQQTLALAGYSEPGLEEVTQAIGGGSKNAVRQLTGLEGDALETRLAAFEKIYERICSDHTALYEGAMALLKKLKKQGAILAVVTMKSKTPTHKILAAHGLDMFDEVITFDDAQKRKPDPDILIGLQKKYGIRPSETLVIGDMARDMAFAHNAAADACAMLHGYGTAQDVLPQRPKYVLSSFRDF